MHEQQSLTTVARPNPEMKSVAHPWSLYLSSFTLNARFQWGTPMKNSTCRL
jgi:hypothetical protein